jgi:tetratricopeptide (TPR) repeat protein
MNFLRRLFRKAPPRTRPGHQRMQFILPKDVPWKVEDVQELEAEGKFREALERWQVLLTPFEDPRMPPDIAQLPSHRYIQLHIGMCSRRLELYPKALDAYGKAAALARQAGDELTLAEVANNVGVVHRNQGELPAALHQFQEAREKAESLKDWGLVATVLDNIAMCHRMQGNREQALREARRAYDILRKRSLQVAAGIQSRVLGNLGVLYIELGEPREGRRLLEQALDKAREAGDHMQETLILENLSRG